MIFSSVTTYFKTRLRCLHCNDSCEDRMPGAWSNAEVKSKLFFMISSQVAHYHNLKTCSGHNSTIIITVYFNQRVCSVYICIYYALTDTRVTCCSGDHDYHVNETLLLVTTIIFRQEIIESHKQQKYLSFFEGKWWVRVLPVIKVVCDRLAYLEERGSAQLWLTQHILPLNTTSPEWLIMALIVWLAWYKSHPDNRENISQHFHQK